MSALIRSASLLLLAVLPLAACSSRSGPETGRMRQSHDANRLTHEQVVGTHTSDAYEAIRILRPNWLRKRGSMSVTQQSDIQVYLDNVQIGGPEVLRSIPANTVGGLQFLDASSATQRWGTGHVHGAILVTTLSRVPDVAWARGTTHIGVSPAATGAADG